MELCLCITYLQSRLNSSQNKNSNATTTEYTSNEEKNVGVVSKYLKSNSIQYAQGWNNLNVLSCPKAQNSEFYLNKENGTVTFIVFIFVYTYKYCENFRIFWQTEPNLNRIQNKVDDQNFRHDQIMVKIDCRIAPKQVIE